MNSFKFQLNAPQIPNREAYHQSVDIRLNHAIVGGISFRAGNSVEPPHFRIFLHVKDDKKPFKSISLKQIFPIDGEDELSAIEAAKKWLLEEQEFIEARWDLHPLVMSGANA